ncbi:MAG: DUF2844 domain-containing protein [Acidobacteriia bacterium]|nr:DUF2844 domain-containing protein [Terriglobia bacterium]
METSIHGKERAGFSQVWLMAAALVTVGLGSPAFAALGGDANSVQADQIHMKATAQIRVSPNGAYSVHELQSPHNTVVREFISSDGRVFGVAWRGPFVPNMRQILGTYFQQYSAAAREAKSKYVGRRPLNIQQPGLVVQTGGHMRSYSGRAYVPEMVPQGVSVNEIR